MILRVLFWTVALGIAVVVAQTVDGEIAGRINDGMGAPLPGVRITITNDGQSRVAITDGEGRFVLPSLAMGTYRVAVDLAGFLSTSGEIRLSASNPRIFLGWSLEAGCSEEEIRVIVGARMAAPSADAILHIRVTSADGPVLMSVRPECAGRVVVQYSVQVLGSAPQRGRTSLGTMQIFMSTGDAHLEPGREYLALLRLNARATGDLVFPIVSGQVTSSLHQHTPPLAGELDGMRVDEALEVLGNWSQERKR